MIEKACKVVAKAEHRYLNPDPARAIEIGDYGRVKDGMLIKRGNLAGWLAAKKVNLPGDVRIASVPSNVEENQTLTSAGVRKTTITLSGDLSAQYLNAKLAFDLAFAGENQYYFHVPGMRFAGMRDMGVIGDALVGLAKQEDHHPQFWEDDYCIVTGVYQVQSFFHVFAEQSVQRLGLTVEAAGTINDLYKVGAKFIPMNETSSSTTLVRSFQSGGSPVTVFYETHKVHWNAFGKKWWDVVEDLNP